MKTDLSLLGIVLLLLFSCSVSPNEIDFGKDQCSFCSMGIVDKTHAAQIVTSKGKQYKYDAIECLIHDIQDEDLVTVKLAYVLVADYSNSGAMINATEAHYLISPNISSPMGAFLSAFGTKESAEETQKEQSGDLYNWSEIQQKMSIKK